MKKLPSAFIIMMLVTRVAAQECWLLPDKFLYERGEPVHIGFRVGENFEGGNWTDDTSRIKSIRFYYGEVSDDLRPAMGFEKGDSIRFSVFDEGTMMVTYSSKDSFINLDSGAFYKRLINDGAGDIIDYRTQNGETDSSGHERFQYVGKTIFQIGQESKNLPDQETGLPLDILLEQNPYNIADSQTITATIVFRNEPLKNTLVKIWHRDHDTTGKEEIQTDDHGVIRFRVTATGTWMLTCVKMVRIATGRRPGPATWQSYRASCTWGYQ
jgi:hypothetical protein